MITDFEKSYRLSDSLFREAKVIIERSHAAEMINDFHDQHRGAGGQDCAGIAYTISAVLVAALGLLMLGRTPTYKAIQQAIGDLTPRQLAEVGMAGQDTSRIFADRAEQRRERTRFVAWLNRRLAPLDPSPDQPARRITNAEHRRIIAHRSTEQRAASGEATERLRTVMNRIVFGSIVDPQPPEAVGDIVADETIFDLAGPSAGLGIKPDKQRGAAYFGSYYSRDKHSTTVYQDASGGGKRGFGIGLTAVIRVGPPDQLHAVAPVVIGMDVHPPTSGSVDGLDVAITHAKRNGLDTRRAGRARLPRLTTDMGYNPKDGFARLMLDHQYAAVVRYPQHWTLTDTAANPPGATADVPPGPIQFAGSFYCPAAADLLAQHHMPKTRDLLADNGWEAHDRRLASVLPFLMGLNSRPRLSRPRGRPPLGVEPRLDVKAELVCPAVQLRVQCPLKPASMTRAAFGAPTAAPTWQASDRQCCAQSIVTVTLTPRQLKKAQWGPVGASWEHILYFEAARARTEQTFSILKSAHVTKLVDLKWGPRREPMVKLLMALAVASTNHRIQKTYRSRQAREESIDVRRRQLRDHLGHEPAKTPPLT
ncbi:UNVERIFIED_ORG: hypothetical protein GGE11_000783 [Mycolicibacterium obuense]